MDKNDIMRVSRKMFEAGRDREEYNDRPQEQFTPGRGRGGKYRKFFETPTSYKEYDKETLKACLEKEIPLILRDFEEAYKSTNYPDYLKNVLGNKRFIKALKKNTDRFEDLSLISFMLAEQLMKNKQVYSDEEIKTSYEEVFFMINSKAFEKFAKKLNLKENVAKELYINICNYESIRPGHIHQRVFNILNVMYARADEVDFDVYAVFKRLFKEYRIDALMGILLEKREIQNSLNSKARNLWSSLTNMVLDAIEEMEKDDIRQFLNIYIKCIKNYQKYNEYLPRISLLNAISGDYENISKAVRKIIDKNEDTKKYFM